MRRVFVTLLAIVGASGMSFGADVAAPWIIAADFQKRGMRELEKAEFGAAVKDLSRALELLPVYDVDNRYACYQGLGAAFLELEKPDRAGESLSRAIELQPRKPDGYLLRAIAYSRMKKYRRALADLEERLRLIPGDHTTVRELACTLSDLGRNDEAMSYAQRLEKDFPKDATSPYTIGYVQFRQKAYEGAVRSFSRAIQLEAGYAEAYLARGQSYRRLGETNKGDSDVKHALQICPSLAAYNEDLVREKPEAGKKRATPRKERSEQEIRKSEGPKSASAGDTIPNY